MRELSGLGWGRKRAHSQGHLGEVQEQQEELRERLEELTDEMKNVERIRRDRPDPSFPVSLRTGWDPLGMDLEDDSDGDGLPDDVLYR